MWNMMSFSILEFIEGDVVDVKTIIAIALEARAVLIA
jgi:hypothetical protein